MIVHFHSLLSLIADEYKSYYKVLMNYRKDLIKHQGAYLIFQPLGGCLFEWGGGLIKYFSL